MRESIAITHNNLEDEDRDLGLLFLNGFVNDGAYLAPEFPWSSYTTDNDNSNVSCDHDRCSLNPTKREPLTPPTEDIEPCTAPGNAIDMRFGRRNGSSESASSAPDQSITQLTSQYNDPSPVQCCFSFHNGNLVDTNTKIVYNDDDGTQPHDMTLNEPSHRPSPSSSVSFLTPRCHHNTKSTTSATTPPVNDDIEQHREKNRLAARKCRRKAKRAAAALERQERELSLKHRELLGHVGSLRGEVLDLKNEVLRHAECGSDVIQNYIANAARYQMGPAE